MSVLLTRLEPRHLAFAAAMILSAFLYSRRDVDQGKPGPSDPGYRAACEGPPLRTIEQRNQAFEDGYSINPTYDCIDKSSFVAVAKQRAEWEAANTPAAIAQRRAERAREMAAAQAEREKVQLPDGLRPVISTALRDYAADRNEFQTTLLRHAPSPQSYPSDKLPADARLIHFPSGDLELSAWVGTPAKAAGRLPVVIFLHGGFAFGADDFDMARPYLAAGFMIVTPILRGENGQGGDFTMFFKEVDDVLAAEAYVRTLPNVDSQRIYLAGHSVGGTLSLLAGMRSSAFRAVVSLSASPDQAIFIGGEPWNRFAPFDRSSMRELQIRSPLAYATSIKRPTRLYCGELELAYTHTTALLAQRARAIGLDVEAKFFSGDHFTAVPAEIAASIAFFDSQR